MKIDLAKTWFRRATIAGLGLLLAACAEPVRLSKPSVGIVAVDGAVTAFSDICLDTAPDFAGAPARFARNGLRNKGRRGVFYDATETLSVRVDRVETVNGPMLRCSVVYEDPNRTIAAERIDRMVADRGAAIKDVRRARFPTVQGGERDGLAWRFLTKGRAGELMDVPHTGNGNLGILILQFPISGTQT